jgi:hypothetical protein
MVQRMPASGIRIGHSARFLFQTSASTGTLKHAGPGTKQPLSFSGFEYSAAVCQACAQAPLLAEVFAVTTNICSLMFVVTARS